jgi:hypothetical protein
MPITKKDVLITVISFNSPLRSSLLNALPLNAFNRPVLQFSFEILLAQCPPCATTTVDTIMASLQFSFEILRFLWLV